MRDDVCDTVSEAVVFFVGLKMAERSTERAAPKPLPKIENSLSEATERAKKTLDDEGSPTSPDGSPECPVCLQSCVHPARLPCGHVFCFLCIKGAAAAQRSRRCALCRRQIPAEFFTDPALVERGPSAEGEEESAGAGTGTGGGPSSSSSSPERGAGGADAETHAWFYEGRNGWWQYDRRTGAELEAGYRAERPSLELLIAGHVYAVDLEGMVQVRRSDPSRRRRVKRDLLSAPKKGIAGLKIAVKPEVPTAASEPALDVESGPSERRASAPDRGETAGGTPPPPPPPPPLRQSGPAPGAALAGGGTGRTKSRTAGVGRDQDQAPPGRQSRSADRNDNYSDGSDEESNDDNDGIENGDSDDHEWRAALALPRQPPQPSQRQIPGGPVSSAPATAAASMSGSSSSGGGGGRYEPMAPAPVSRQRPVPVLPASELREPSQEARQARVSADARRSLPPSTAPAAATARRPGAVADWPQESLDRGLRDLQLSPPVESLYEPMTVDTVQPQDQSQQRCRRRHPRPRADSQS